MEEQDGIPVKPDIIGIFVSPFIFVVILWLIKYVEWKYNWNFTEYGLYPKSISGLRGIFFSPLIHSDFYHLLSNSIPLLILGSMMLHFYKSITYKVFFMVYLFSGTGAWFFARPSYHIGASGLVYGLVCFLFVSGVIRRNIQLLALSMLVTFLYGGLVWGILPLPTGMSWESHLMGSIVGIVCAWLYREQGPRNTEYKWEDEDTDPNWYPPEELATLDSEKPDAPVINYEIKEKESK